MAQNALPELPDLHFESDGQKLRVGLAEQHVEDTKGTLNGFIHYTHNVMLNLLRVALVAASVCAIELPSPAEEDKVQLSRRQVFGKTTYIRSLNRSVTIESQIPLICLEGCIPPISDFKYVPLFPRPSGTHAHLDPHYFAFP